MLVEWHRRRFELLCDAQPDVLAFETIPCRNEVQAFCQLLAERPSARAWVTLACRSPTLLNSGETVADVVQDIERLDTNKQIEAIGVNCTAPQYLTGLIECIRQHSALPIIVYPNSGERWDSAAGKWFDSPDLPPFHEMAMQWTDAAAVIGGCCRVGPADLQKLKVNIAAVRSGKSQGLLRTAPAPGQKSSKANHDVILDVDTGIDDAWALLLAFATSELNVLGVTTVAGNMDVDTVTTATLKVLDAASAQTDVPVAKGAGEALVEPPHYCPKIHGNDALGDLDFPPSKYVVPSAL